MRLLFSIFHRGMCFVPRNAEIPKEEDYLCYYIRARILLILLITKCQIYFLHICKSYERCREVKLFSFIFFRLRAGLRGIF